VLGSSLPQACGAQFALLLSPAVYARTRPAGESSDPAAEWLRHTPARLTAALAASAAVLLLAVPLAELRPHGTFTSAALPPHIGTATPETYGQDGSITGAWPARGTWTLSPAGLTAHHQA
jgi:hypothetical protein